MHVIDDKTRVMNALRDAQGNLTRAARLLGVSKQYFISVVKRLELTTWASELRIRYGAPLTGRPPNAVRDYLDTVAPRPRKRREVHKRQNDVVQGEKPPATPLT